MFETATIGIEFQFHSGSIKSGRIRITSFRDSEFQFHSGSIKRHYQDHCPTRAVLVSIP